MTFDPTQPTDTTKIRNLGIVIRPNWQAIEDADSSFKPIALNLDNRTPLAPPNDPAAIAEAYLLYCKEDVTGNPEFFGIDEDSVISQLTSADYLLAQDGHAMIPPGFLINWGRTTILNNTASIAVVFTRAFNAAPWIIEVTPLSNAVAGATAPRQLGAQNLTTTGFDAVQFGGTVNANTLVAWIAIGELA